MWHVSYYLFYEYAVSLTILSVQLHIYATCNKLWENVFMQTLVKIKNKSFSILARHRLY